MKKSKSGITIIELMVAIASSAVLAIGIGSVLYFSFLSWNRNIESVEVQRDATLATRVLKKQVRLSRSIDITVQPNRIDFEANDVRINPQAIYVQDDDLIYDNNTTAAGGEMVLVDQRLDPTVSIPFDPQIEAAGISFTLYLLDRKDRVAIEINTEINARN